MKENNEDEGFNSPSLQSGSIVILAADAALAAVRAHFAEQMEANYWETVRYQRAALKTALASLVDDQ